MILDLYFSDYFGVSEEILDEYGAFNISLVSDLPLFVDPFLLFHSQKPEYQELHQQILRYLRFLRNHAESGTLAPGLITAWYTFPEVKQNWLGFSVMSNKGHGLGRDFAEALHSSLGSILGNLGRETITLSSHLEKVALISEKVGRDSISDFTTNLIKGFLLEYTQSFARLHLDESRRRSFSIRKVRFNYETETWESGTYELPAHDNDYVILTPADILTRDDTWICQADLVRQFDRLPAALPDQELRAQVSNYFHKHLSENPSRRERSEAVRSTIREYPDLVDYYIRIKEDEGDEAESASMQKVKDTHEVFVEQARQLIRELADRTDFYGHRSDSYTESLKRVHVFKYYIEHQDGYLLINRQGKLFASEKEVQIFFGLVWCGTTFDVNREPNNGRGPVDYKISKGSNDRSLIEFKLGSNTKLRPNLQKQVRIYEQANQTKKSIKVIVVYSEKDATRVQKILEELGLAGREDVVVIDARSDNKPSASTA